METNKDTMQPKPSSHFDQIIFRLTELNTAMNKEVRKTRKHTDNLAYISKPLKDSEGNLQKEPSGVLEILDSELNSLYFSLSELKSINEDLNIIIGDNSNS